MLSIPIYVMEIYPTSTANLIAFKTITSCLLSWREAFDRGGSRSISKRFTYVGINTLDVLAAFFVASPFPRGFGYGHFTGSV
jgi:hypothetical protein